MQIPNNQADDENHIESFNHAPVAAPATFRKSKLRLH